MRPRGVSENKKTPSHFAARNGLPGMVREVGFEPTNPYGTGASGLRVQDPTYVRRVSLTWLGNTSRPQTRRTPANTRPAPAKTQTKTTPLIGFRQSIKSIKSG